MNITKVIWIGTGMLCLGLGSVGIVLPILPTVPFYMATVVCFARGSKRLHTWFTGTTLYKKYIESFQKEGTMEFATKCRIFAMVTLLMGTGYMMMSRVTVGRIIIGIVWIGHIWMLFFHIPTKKKTVAEKRALEQQTVEEMIHLYCHKVHTTKDGLCNECRALSNYAKLRSQKCPFIEEKTFCSNCEVHCYKEDMRDQIRIVMRYSGPRMLLHHPVMAIRHVILQREKGGVKE